jgi:hypothetical protein
VAIVIRNYRDSDFEAVKELHRSRSLEYKLPEFEEKMFPVRSVIEEDGKIKHAAFLRKVANAYLFLGEGSKKELLGRLLIFQRELRLAAKNKGFDEVEAFLPPEMEAKFGKLLTRLGWKKCEYPCYFFKIGGEI